MFDKRSNWQYLWDHALDNSSLLAIIFKKTLVTPYYISTFVYFNSLMLNITLNAVFYNDSQVEEKHQMGEDDVSFNIIK